MKYVLAAKLVDEPVEALGGWTNSFTDPRLCGAIVDRLTFNATIIDTGSDFYRMAQTRTRQAAEPA